MWAKENKKWVWVDDQGDKQHGNLELGDRFPDDKFSTDTPSRLSWVHFFNPFKTFPSPAWGFVLGALVTILVLSVILALMMSMGVMTPVFLWFVDILQGVGISATIGSIQIAVMLAMPALGLLESLISFFVQKPCVNFSGLHWPANGVGFSTKDGFWRSFSKGFLSALDGFLFSPALLFQGLDSLKDLLFITPLVAVKNALIEWLPAWVSWCLCPKTKLPINLQIEIDELNKEIKKTEALEKKAIRKEEKSAVLSEEKKFLQNRKDLLLSLFDEHMTALDKNSEWSISRRKILNEIGRMRPIKKRWFWERSEEVEIDRESTPSKILKKKQNFKEYDWLLREKIFSEIRRAKQLKESPGDRSTFPRMSR